MIEALAVSATLCLGLFAGSLLTEALLLVPYFRSLGHAEFYRLHADFGPRLYRYYAPLTLAATIIPLLSSIALTLLRPQGSLLALVATGLGCIILATYLAYFRRANAAFAAKSLDAPSLTLALGQWSRVHSLRTALALTAFAASTLSLIQLSAI